METALTLIGFVTCFIAILVAIVKFMEAVWFFQEFRKETAKKLEALEKTLREQKP